MNMLCGRSNSKLTISKINNCNLKEVTNLSSSNKVNIKNYLICKDVKAVRYPKKKAVRFTHIDDILHFSMSDVDADDRWYSQTDLQSFRSKAADEARCIILNITHPDKYLHKAYNAARNGHLKSASAILEPWCSFTNEYTCRRGIEKMFRSRALEKLETDRRLSMEKVMKLQDDLLGNCSTKDEKTEMMKKNYGKACKGSRNFSFAMGIADSIAVDGKNELKAKRRTVDTKLSKNICIGRQA